ncbi:MAG TPA: GNAT family protein [Acidimicrobiales bacterium]|nr:GNAT family protein [Acidimicrobiales bacterium]
MAHRHWPLFDLEVRTPRLELRLPTDDELCDLADLAAAGVHDPASMPFQVPWTDAEPPALQRGVLQWGWRNRAEWTPERWNLALGVFVDGRIVGVQDVGASRFALTRAVSTGSWLGLAHQGRGLGTEMRAAVLHLAFDGLGAVEAHSGAWHDNARSHAVSARLGYEENGRRVEVRRDRADEMVLLRLTRERWAAGRRDDVAVDGLEPCLELFGLPA